MAMNSELRQPLTSLPKGRTLRVSDGRGRVIAVFAGRVWITQDNDSRDIVVEAGESFQIDRDGLTLAMALRDSQVMLLAAEPSAPLRSSRSYRLALGARGRRHAGIARSIAAGLAWLQRAVRHALGGVASRAVASAKAPRTQACPQG
jgi:hypothetical protein